MAQRQQQPLIACLFIFGVTGILLFLRFQSDLNFPLLFLVKTFFLYLSFLFIAVALTVSLWFRNKWVTFSFILSIIFLSPFISPNLKSNNKAGETQEASFSIATFSTMTRTENISDIIQFAEQKAPDILCLQEVSKPHLVDVEKKLVTRYPFSITNSSNLTLFSRFKIDSSRDTGAFIMANIDIPEVGPTTILNAHMPRQYRQQETYPAWQELLNTLNSIKSNQSVLCGDLNLTPYNTMYDIITHKHGYKDAVSRGYGFTFPNAQRRISIFGVLIKLDYLLASNLIAYNTRNVNASELSDHRALITQYKKK